MLAENPRAVVGGNFPPPDCDDDLPPKGQRIVCPKRRAALLIVATLAAKRCELARKDVLQKRKGGEEGRFLRGFLITYMRGLNSPVWECAILFDLNRKQIGQEEQAFLDICVRNIDIEEEVEHLTDMCDAALRFDRERFMHHGLTERAADAAARKAIKTAKEAADLIEANTPKPKPKKKAVSEAERIQAEANARRKDEALQQQISIARAVIAKAKGPKATKEQRKDAERAERELDALEAKLKKPAKA